MYAPNSQEYADLTFTNEVIENRIAYQESRMKELNKEYRDMSWMENTLQKTQFESALQSMRYLEEKQKICTKQDPCIIKEHTASQKKQHNNNKTQLLR